MEPAEDHLDAVTAVAISPDGETGASCSRTGELRLWNLRYGMLDAYFGVGTSVADHAVFLPSPPLRLLTNGDVSVLWTMAGDRIERRGLPWYGGSVLTTAERDGVLRAGGLRWLGIFASGGRIPLGTIAALTRSPSGLIVAADEHGRLGAWSRITRHGDPDQKWSADGADGDPHLTRGCDDWRLVVSVRADRVLVLDTETGAQVTSFVPPSRPTAIAAHPDRPLVALGGRDGSLTWWDVRSGRRLGHVQAHGERVRDLAFATRTDLVMSVSQDGTAALWRLHGHRPVGRFTPAPETGPRELTRVTGTPDGTRWLLGGRGGQVHILHMTARRGLTAQRAGRPTGGGPDVETLIDDVRHHREDRDTALDAILELGTDLGPEWRETASRPLADVTGRGVDPVLREVAAKALAGLDESEATTALYVMAARFGSAHGSAGRLRAHVTGEESPTVDHLVASLPGAGNFRGVLTTSALAEHGEAAVPALCAALDAFPLPASHEDENWMGAETTKYRLMHAMCLIGPAAAPAAATLIAILEDDEIYRDTRHQAEVALRALAAPEAANVLASEILRRAEAWLAADRGDDVEGFGELLRILAAMPPHVLAASDGVHAALEAVRRVREEPDEDGEDDTPDWMLEVIDEITARMAG